MSKPPTFETAFPQDDSRCANCGAPAKRVEMANPPQPGLWTQRYDPRAVACSRPHLPDEPSGVAVEAAVLSHLESLAASADAARHVRPVLRAGLRAAYTAERAQQEGGKERPATGGPE